MDRLSEKYNSYSGYVSCLDNPLSYLDANGDSCIILLAPYGANNFGHLAIAIQNGKGDWRLYSKNGTDKMHGFAGEEGAQGTEKHNDRGEKKANNIERLFNDESINPKKANDGTMVPEYTEGYMLYTTPEQDKKMMDGALEIINENYNLLFSNCAQTVQNALKNAGLNPGSGCFPKSKVYPSIVKNNKKGKKVLFYNTKTNKYYKYGK